MTLKEMLHMVTQSGGRLMIIGCERCNCGEIIRHNNGGNYHRRVWIYWVNGEFVVWWGNTKEWFPGDEEWWCDDCLMFGRQDENHSHYTIDEVDMLVEEILDWVGSGAIYLEDAKSRNTVAAVYIEDEEE
jgi:late competence protein required for DNA uptake (superfamily II DNA/RNA helicase)